MATSIIQGVRFSDKVVTGQLSSITEVTGTSDSRGTEDSGQVLKYTNASAVTITLAANAAIGTTLLCLQWGTGQLQFAAASGASIVNNNAHTNSNGTQYDQCMLKVVENSGGSAAVWHLSGDTGV